MEFLLSSLVLGLAGFDIFGFAILLAAHSSKASKMAIMLFAAIVFVATVVGGVTISLFFAIAQFALVGTKNYFDYWALLLAIQEFECKQKIN
jgi:hypothetical protein